MILKLLSIFFFIHIIAALKVLKAFISIIADMLSNKKLNQIVTELFIKRRKLKIYLVFITQYCFAVKKSIRINSTHYFIMEIPDK